MLKGNNQRNSRFTISRTQKQNGFTLLELMIVVAIVGVLMAVAIPSYLDSVQKARRSDAMSALMDVANRLEQYMLDNNTYTTDLAKIKRPNPTPEGHYNIKIEAPSGGSITSRYELTATPVATSPQNDETKCTVYTLDSSGLKGNKGTLGTACW